MKASQKKHWPRSNLSTTVLGFGAAQLGNFNREMSDAEAQTLIEASWDAGVRFYDTAPSYGHGLSEARLGQGLHWKPHSEFILSTKVGRLLSPRARGEIDFTPWVNGLPFERRFDYSYDGAMRSIEDSLQRTGLEYIDVALIHEVDAVTHGNQPGDRCSRGSDVQLRSGQRSVEQLHENVATLNAEIPTEFWHALKMSRLIREDAPIP